MSQVIDATPQESVVSPSNGARVHSVVIVSAHLHPEDDATGALMTSVATGLAARGFTVSALAAHPSYFNDSKAAPRRMYYKGVRIGRVWSTRFGRRRLAGRIADAVSITISMALRILLLPRQTIVVVVTNPPTLPIAGALRRLLGRGRLIIVIHDVFPDSGVRLGFIRKGGVIHRLLRWTTNAVLRQADGIIVLGRDMQTTIRSRLPTRYRGRVKFVPNWADGEEIRVKPKSESSLAAAERLERTFTVQYSGNIGRSQGLEVILDAAEKLRDAGITFSIVGEGSSRDRLMALAVSRSLSNVRFRPRVERAALSDSLAACDIALISLSPGMGGLSVPSKYYAALASGRPVVAVMEPDTEVAMSVVEDHCGVVVPPGDASALARVLVELRDDPVRTGILGFNARQTFEAKYDVDRAIDEYTAVIESAARSRPPSLWRPRIWDVGLVVVALVVAITVGLAYHLSALSLLIGLAVVAVSGGLIVLYRVFRVAFVLLGGLAVFWSSAELDLSKVVYTACLVVALGIAIRRVSRERWSKSYRVLTPVLVASSIFLVLILLSVAVSTSMGTPVTSWYRDAAPYLLFGAVPFLVYDWQRVGSTRFIAIFLTITGIVSAASLTVVILTRREAIRLPLNHFLLPSAMLAMAAVCYAAAKAVQEPRARVPGFLACVAIGGLLLLSGTRTFLVLAIPIVVVLIVASGRVPGWRGFVGGFFLLGAIAITVHFVAQWIGGGLALAVMRFEAVPSVFVQPSNDLSYKERAQEVAAAWQVFSTHPLLGVGPGHVFTWTNWTGALTSSFNIDTGLSLLAKFGLLGAICVAGIGLSIAQVLRRLPNSAEATPVKASLIGYAIATVALMPFAAPLEDKGFVFGWALLLSLAIRVPRISSQHVRISAQEIEDRKRVSSAKATSAGHFTPALRDARVRRQLVAMAIVLALLGSLGGGAFLAYASIKGQAGQLQARLTNHLELGQRELEAAKTSLKQANLTHDDKQIAEAKVHFINAKLQFLAASQIADSSELLARLEDLPSVGQLVASRHSAVDEIAAVGVHLSQAGLELADLDTLLIKPPTSSQQVQGFLNTMNQIKPKIDPVRAELSAALKAADAMDLSLLPSSQKATFLRARGTISQALAAIDQFKDLVPILTEILGGNGARSYLIEQVNPAELRPGGGFIGTFSLLRADNGLLTVKSGDVQEFIAARGSLGGANYIEPPGPFREWLPYNGWSFIDSNFYADFPTNARKAQELVRQRLGPVDGVIAIDYFTVAKLLGITGPITVPKFNITLNEGNFIATVVKYGLDTLIDPSYYEAHKAILFATAGPLFQKVVTLQPAKWTVLIGALNELAASRHFQVYFNNPDVQKTIMEYGWAGDMKNSGKADYLMEVEANLGGTKANYFVTRNFKLELTRDRANFHHRLSVEITDNTPYIYRGFDYYQVYTRLLISGNTTASSNNLLHGPPGFIGRTLPGPPPPPGLQQMEGWKFTRGYGNGMTMVFDWDTPWTPNHRGEEQIYWQKQPGTSIDKVDVIWNDGNGHAYRASGDLGQDRVVTLNPRGVTLTQGQLGTFQLPSLSLG